MAAALVGPRPPVVTALAATIVQRSRDLTARPLAGAGSGEGPGLPSCHAKVGWLAHPTSLRLMKRESKKVAHTGEVAPELLRLWLRDHRRARCRCHNRRARGHHGGLGLRRRWRVVDGAGRKAKQNYWDEPDDTHGTISPFAALPRGPPNGGWSWPACARILAGSRRNRLAYGVVITVPGTAGVTTVEVGAGVTTVAGAPTVADGGAVLMVQAARPNTTNGMNQAIRMWSSPFSCLAEPIGGQLVAGPCPNRGRFAVGGSQTSGLGGTAPGTASERSRRGQANRGHAATAIPHMGFCPMHSPYILFDGRPDRLRHGGRR